MEQVKNKLQGGISDFNWSKFYVGVHKTSKGAGLIIPCNFNSTNYSVHSFRCFTSGNRIYGQYKNGKMSFGELFQIFDIYEFDNLCDININKLGENNGKTLLL